MLRSFLRCAVPLTWLASLLALATSPPPLAAAGAPQWKSGPVQVSADGRHVWVADALGREVIRVAVDGTRLHVDLESRTCTPTNLSVGADGVLVSCERENAVLALDAEGAVVSRLELPWGSGPSALALAPDGASALLSLKRAAAIARVDVSEGPASLRLAQVTPLPFAPAGLVWSPRGDRAWVAQFLSDGETARVAELRLVRNTLRVHAVPALGMQEPQRSTATDTLPEGGAVLFTAHPAVRPDADGGVEPWFPARHLNANADVPSPYSTVQSAVHRLRPGAVGFVAEDRRVPSALLVHDPDNPTSLLGIGWAASVSGPVDLGFSADGAWAYVLHENSADLLFLPTDAGPVADAGDALTELPIGERPIGMALSPTGPVAYVFAQLSKTLWVVDLETPGLLAQHPLGDRVDDLSPLALEGARLFHDTTDPRVAADERVACASCHVDGEHDGLVWAFQNGGEAGPRATLSLRGQALTVGPPDPETGLGQFHRSGDVSSLGGFACAFTSARQGGAGFAPGRGDYGGICEHVPQAQALTEFLLDLPPLDRSPARGPSGELSAGAVRGAQLFATSPGDGVPACADCHNPATGFADLKFHDVGAYRSPEELQLPRSDTGWRVNTPTLVGLFATAPHDDGGLPGRAFPTVRDLLEHYAGHDHHGRTDWLAPAQRADLAEFLSSIDGALGATEAAAIDSAGPRLLRVAVTSPHRIEVWFDETVDPATAADPALWSVSDETGQELPVLAAERGPHGDRVSLHVDLPTRCLPRTFTVSPGPVLDATPGGPRNALDVTDSANRASVTLSRELTITVGGSGRENLTVPVLDGGLAGPDHPARGLDAITLLPGDEPVRGFLRFAWRDAFIEATGIEDPSRIVAATIELEQLDGAPQPVRLRRVLQPWTEATHFGDADPASAFGPNWLEHAPGSRWNAPGASAVGGTGEPEEHGRDFDLTATIVASSDAGHLDEPLRFVGLASSYRSWLEHPDLAWGHALELAPGASEPLRLRAAEHRAGFRGPVLFLTYEVPEVGVRAGEPGCPRLAEASLGRGALDGPRTRAPRPGPRQPALDGRTARLSGER